MFLALLMALATASVGTPRLAEIKPAPEVALIDQDGRPMQLSGLRGKVVLVSFIFTTCNGSCPATTHRLARIREELARHKDLKDRIHFLSISVDPERDTPEVLRGYRRLYDIEGKDWSFVTGSTAQVKQTLAAWGMWAKPAANGQLDHPSRIFLVDGRGTIREIYSLEFLRVTWVIEDLRELLR